MMIRFMSSYVKGSVPADAAFMGTAGVLLFIFAGTVIGVKGKKFGFLAVDLFHYALVISHLLFAASLPRLL
jgi:hypothetical protein